MTSFDASHPEGGGGDSVKDAWIKGEHHPKTRKARKKNLRNMSLQHSRSPTKAKGKRPKSNNATMVLSTGNVIAANSIATSTKKADKHLTWKGNDNWAKFGNHNKNDEDHDEFDISINTGCTGSTRRLSLSDSNTTGYSLSDSPISIRRKSISDSLSVNRRLSLSDSLKSGCGIPNSPLSNRRKSLSDSLNISRRLSLSDSLKSGCGIPNSPLSNRRKSLSDSLNASRRLSLSDSLKSGCSISDSHTTRRGSLSDSNKTRRLSLSDSLKSGCSLSGSLLDIDEHSSQAFRRVSDSNKPRRQHSLSDSLKSGGGSMTMLDIDEHPSQAFRRVSDSSETRLAVLDIAEQVHPQILQKQPRSILKTRSDSKHTTFFPNKNDKAKTKKNRMRIKRKRYVPLESASSFLKSHKKKKKKKDKDPPKRLRINWDLLPPPEPIRELPIIREQQQQPVQTNHMAASYIPTSDPIGSDDDADCARSHDSHRNSNCSMDQCQRGHVARFSDDDSSIDSSIDSSNSNRSDSSHSHGSVDNAGRVQIRRVIPNSSRRKGGKQMLLKRNNNAIHRSCNSNGHRTARSGKTRTKKVGFGSVTIRSYQQTLGDNPAVTKGPPIQLDWEYDKESIVIALNQYESGKRRKAGRTQPRILTERKRQIVLSREYGFSQSELLDAKQAASKTRLRRAVTNALTPLSPFEDALESACRKARRVFARRKKRASSGKE